MESIVQTLRKRGFIDATTSEELDEKAKKPLTVYVGFDPTADSLHLGNFVSIMGLAWFQRAGHNVIAVVGGATGMIGDPSGKSSERNLLDEATIQKNLQGIRSSIERVLTQDKGKGSVKILNNYEWFKDYKFIDFLRDVGKHFRLGTMLSKDSVKSRFASAEGISYTEFSYQLLQAYDFLYLFDHHQVELQMGGSDQWGNIVAGTELIRKMRGASAYGLTWPLLTRSDGKKFGKSEEGAIWLNADKLAPYDFYQYLYRFPDADVIRLFKMLTFVDLEEIQEIEASMQRPGYIPNTAQKRLAEEVTRILHGQTGVDEALKITAAAAPGAKTQLDKETLEALAKELGKKNLSFADVIGKKLIDLLVKAEVVASKAEARRMLAGGGIYLNNEKEQNEDFVIHSKNLIEGKFILLGVGKKRKIIIEIG